MPSDEQVAETYRKTCSIWTTGELLGISGQCVQERLVSLGIKRTGGGAPWTEDEIKRLQREYTVYRDAGTLADLAVDMGRNKTTVCAKARALGLTDKRAQKPYFGKWKYMTEDAARMLMDDFKTWHGGTTAAFCASRGYAKSGFEQTMKRFFPDEWSIACESHAPKTSFYKLGRAFEYRARNVLKAAGYFVLRSPRSAGPADLVAIRRGAILFVQCKRNSWPTLREAGAFYDISVAVGAYPVLARMMGTRGTSFFVISERPVRKGYAKTPLAAELLRPETVTRVEVRPMLGLPERKPGKGGKP